MEFIMYIYRLVNPRIRSVVKVQTKKVPGGRQFYGTFINQYQLIFFVKGRTEVVFDDTAFTDKPGELIFLPTGPCKNYYADVIEEGECIAIFFDAEGELPEHCACENFIDNINLQNLFVKMNQVWNKKEPGYYNRCLSLFYLILEELEKAEESYLPQKKKNKLAPAVEHIHSHYCDADFPYMELHGMCGISYTYFKQLFVKAFGTTPSEYVRNLRINRACELLKTGNFSVSDVSEMCGFSDPAYFSRVFKEKMGVSPKAYL